MPKRAVKMRKLHVGEIVLGKRTNGISSDGGSSSGGEGWFAGKIMAALGYRNYRLLMCTNRNLLITFPTKPYRPVEKHAPFDRHP